MPKNNEFINPGSKTSTAHVAPMRSEIRVSFLANVVETANRAVTFFCLHSAFISLVSVVLLSLGNVLGVSLPWWAVSVLAVTACVGFIYTFFRIIAEADAFERQQKGGNR